MSRIQTFDHCGFVVEDIPRAHRFYEDLLGAKPLRIQNLNTRRLYGGGFPVMSFVEMGAHRFELCLAQEPLAPQGKAGMPRIGFLLTETAMDELIQQLRRSEIPYEGAGNLPSGGAPRSNHSGTGCGRQHPRILGPQTGRDLVIAYEDISHLAMEVTDLNAAERFYAGALGMELICRDSGDLGNDV